MNAISKRLLSWLCVIAMVFSFVPVMDLSGFAVTTKAAEIEYGSANYEGVDAAIIEQMNAGNAIDNSDEAFAQHLANNTCPICGDISGMEGGGWVPLTAAKNMGGSQNKKYHFYYEDSVKTCTGNMIGFYKSGDNDAINNTACVWLKSTNNITNTSNRCVMLSGANNTVNFFGQGTITTDIAEAAASYNMFQVGSGTLNLYGGNFIYQHPQVDFRKAAIRVAGDSAVVNIYAGAKIGPATQDASKVCQNVQYTGAGTVNMFGGEIRNGVAPAWGYSGNVTVSSSGKFNMYGGTISNGTFLSAETEGVTANATIGGNVMVGGKNQDVAFKEDGSVNYTCTAGTFNMYGGTITGGKANNGGNGGGNINIYHGNAVMNMQGGTVSGGYAKADGGNIQVCGGTLNVSGTALITGGEAVRYGGNIQMSHTSGDLKISGGKIAAGNAANGGNIYVDKAGTFVLSDGIIDGGESTGYGGNIYLGADNTAHSFTGGTVQNGIATTQGGGIHATCDLTLSGTNFIDNIGRTGGGNVNLGARSLKLTVTDGIIAGGWVTGPWNETENNYKPTGANWGGNIRGWACDVEITGGLIYGGARGPAKSAHAGNNVASLSSVDSSSKADLPGASLTIGGDAIIVGDVNLSAPSSNTAGFKSPGTTVSLKGAPKLVTRYTLADGTEVKASSGGLNISATYAGVNIGELTADAEIVFTAALGKVLSVAHENAANVVAACSMSNSAYVVSVNEANELVVIEKPVEKPAKPVASEMGDDNWTDAAWDKNADAKLLQAEMTKEKLAAHIEAGTCPICGKAEWIEANVKPGKLNTADTKYHYYIDEDTVVPYDYNWLCLYGSNQSLCVALLNGETEKEISGLIATRGGSSNGVVNIMGEGVIKCGNAMSDKLGLFRVQGTNSTMNIYGGTFYRIFEENADGQTAPKGALLSIDAGTCNIFEGVTIGRAEQAETAHFNVFVKKGTLNMYGGTIQNGRSNFGSSTLADNYSGNVTLFDATSVFNMYGGTIKNGGFTSAVTAGYGGNIAQCKSGATVNITGGTVENGSAPSYGGNIYGYGMNLTISGGQFLGGSAPSGANVTLAGASVAEITGYAKIANGQCTSETVSDGGGNVKVAGTTQLTISGGLIADGSTNCGPNGDGKTADGTRIGSPCGGNIHINGATVTMTGGEISGGASASSTASGSIYITGNGKFNMSGGKLHGGRALSSGGGNIGVWKGTVELSGTAEVYDGFSGGSGGNISIASGSTTTNALTIKSGAKVYNGVAGATEAPELYTLEELQAAVEAGTTTAANGLTNGKNANGGNINMNGGTGDYKTTLTIEEGAQVYGGLTSALVKGTITGTGEDQAVKNAITGGFGGNIYIAGKNDVATIAGTVSGGTAYWGGNVGVNNGATVTITGTLDAGHAYLGGDHGGGNLAIEKGTVTVNGIIKNGTSDANGGNIHFKNDSSTLTISGGEITGGVAANQGGAIRGYNGHIYMTGGKIYGNEAKGAPTDNVWCVRTHLTMSGDAQVIATEGAYRSGVSMTAYGGESATLTLSDNASITGANGAAVVMHADDTTAASFKVADGWTGTAYVHLDGTSYKAGDDVAVERGIVVKDDAQGGAYTGSLYYGTSAIGVLAKADGSLYLGSAAVADKDGNVEWVTSNEAALDAYAAGNAEYVILNGAAEINGNVKIDLNGSNVELTGSGTVYGMDSSNDDYEGYKKLTVAEGIIVAADVVNPVNGNRYISLKEGEGEWSFHRVELVLTHVTLRTTEAGLYYKAKYLCDEKLAGQVLGYGVVLSTANMPGNDFLTETKDINDWTMIDGPLTPDDDHIATTTSGGLFGVLKDIETTTRTADENVTAAQMNVYANLYLAIDRLGDGNMDNAEYIMGDTENQDQEAGTAWNLLGVLEAINKTENWSRYTETQKTNVKNAVLTWATWITEDAQANWAAKLDNILA